MRALRGVPAVVALVLLAGCEPDAPPPSAPPPAPAVAPPAAPAADEAPPAPPPEPTPDPLEDDLTGPLDHPDGVPFPLPDPLPPEARPRVIEGAPLPEPGPAPLAFWVGGTGTADGRLQYPRAIVAEADGSALVCDKTGRIQRWDPEGRLRAVVRTPAIAQGKPTGLGVDAEGQVLVADTHYCRVLVYGPDLALRRVYGAPGRASGQFMFISAVREGPAGLHWTADYGDDVARVQALRPDGAPLRATGHYGTGEGELRRPMSLAFGPAAGEVYVADAVNHRIAVLALDDGRWLRTIGRAGRGPGELDFPYDIALDDEGRLWVAEFGNQRVQVLDPHDGACLGLWGAPGRRPGALGRPWGLALGKGDRLWVLDSHNDRLYALDRARVLEGAPAGGRGRIPAPRRDG
ncbi:MAG: SMP-30/gluconolactonase/LRE family protein [Planctomycetes bacterium]|nr:SMP-30/gluconolactonase/LRE family protein [Planctomycetota bacterium]